MDKNRPSADFCPALELSPSPNESHVEQQSPGNYDPSELMEELDDFVKNYQPDQSRDSLGS